MSVGRRIVLLLSLLGAVGASALGAPSSAMADRCQPEELVFGPGHGLTDEEDNAACVVALRVVYPALACDYTTFPRCLQTLDPAATVAMLPYTVSQTPGRTQTAVAEVPAATIRAAKDGCILDVRWTTQFITCRVDALRNRLPPVS
ncbi:MAG TPA: hypothetical protein VF587_09745 [Solirubrobacteraceae bacterium]|jgi:hypothetical protein